MQGWILYKTDEENLPNDVYGLRRVLEVGRRVGIDLTVMSPEQVDLLVTREDRKSVLVNNSAVQLPDFLLPRMGASTTYFALALIRHLERLGVATFNSSESIEAVRDKLYTQQILAQSNLPIAKTMLARQPVDTDIVDKQLGFPVVVKTISGSQGSGVFLCESRAHFEDLMNLLTATRSNVNIILQEFIADSYGRDLRVIVVGGQAVGAMERRATDGSFKANVSRGGESLPHALSREAELLAVTASDILGLSIAGIDILFGEDHFRICEANSSPGFKGFESCSGVSVPHKILELVVTRLGELEYVERLAQDLLQNEGELSEVGKA
jgi:gamma-F420-2:alpha-L-glutamate ligase